ncbi:IclR family transcriptional regulator [Prodigiosinella aquatilis]|nr:IclR family transcriptional regulator [Prodigiosinella sp. LS101]WJV53762.1 IclR family transcriptional regulator [Prodigiosinella sp. LS101]WJV58123.1 IclR family transcriptional regulator [Pectobacteriaceae bacterium C111]
MSRQKTTDVDRSVKAVKRTLAILDAFIHHSGGITLSELEAQTGLFKSVILRYMLSLEAERYVLKRVDGSYELGSRAYQLGCTYERTFNLREHVLPVLDKLTDATLESSTFFVRDGDHRLCLLRKDSPQHIKSSVPVGTMLPMDDTSAAHVLRTFEQGMPAKWSFPAGLFTSTGAGANRQASTTYLTASISAPVFKHDNQLAGALSISGPTSRFDPADTYSQQLLMEAAIALSLVLGAVMPG